VRVGAAVLVAPDGRSLDAASFQALKTDVSTRLKAMLREAGYPAQADPAQVNLAGVFLILMLLVIGATALYGPEAACLVELFPTRIRYTALSLPYHIGTGWVGGFLPAAAYAMTIASGDIYFGLWYPVIATVSAIIVTIVYLPETRGRAIDG
jgi:hypothetical protein